MTVLTNSFEGGTSGTTITTANSGGGSGNAFDATTIGTGATDIYDNTRSAHGTLSCKIATTTSNVQCLNRWSTSMGTVTQVWFRGYYFFTALPAAITRIMSYATSGGATCGIVALNTNGKLTFLNAGGSSVITMTNVIPTNAWFRIEGYLTGSTTVGQVELKLFESIDSFTPTESQTSTAVQNTGGAPGLYSFGQVSALTNSGPFWMDDIGISSTGYIGPAGVAPTNSGAFMQFFV